MKAYVTLYGDDGHLIADQEELEITGVEEKPDYSGQPYILTTISFEKVVIYKRMV